MKNIFTREDVLVCGNLFPEMFVGRYFRVYAHPRKSFLITIRKIKSINVDQCNCIHIMFDRPSATELYITAKNPDCLNTEHGSMWNWDGDRYFMEVFDEGDE